MDDQFDSEETFTLNIERCIADKTVPAVIRELFKQLRDDGYINVGKYFADLSDIDLDTLGELADRTHPDFAADLTEEEAMQGLEVMVLLGMALTVGEGGIITEDTCETCAKIAIGYIAIENLYRKGLVNVFRENWTMTEDGDKPIVELRQQE